MYLGWNLLVGPKWFRDTIVLFPLGSATEELGKVSKLWIIHQVSIPSFLPSNGQSNCQSVTDALTKTNTLLFVFFFFYFRGETLASLLWKFPRRYLFNNIRKVLLRYAITSQDDCQNFKTIGGRVVCHDSRLFLGSTERVYVICM